MRSTVSSRRSSVSLGSFASGGSASLDALNDAAAVAAAAAPPPAARSLPAASPVSAISSGGAGSLLSLHSLRGGASGVPWGAGDLSGLSAAAAAPPPPPPADGDAPLFTR